MKNHHDSRAQLDTMLELKNQLIDRIILVGTILGISVFVVAKFPFENFAINPDFFSDIIALTVLLVISISRTRLSLKVKTNIVLGILFLTVISDLIENGLFTPDPVLIVLIPFLTILAYDLRTTVIIYTISSAAFLLMGFFIVAGFFEPVIANSYSNSYFRWIEHLLMYTVVAFVITIFLYRFHTTIYELIDNLKRQNENLAEREVTLTTIIENFPRSYVTLIDKDLNIISTGGRAFQNRELDQKKTLGLPVDKAMSYFGKRTDQAELIEVFKATFNGEEHELEVPFGDAFMQVKTAPLMTAKGEVNTILAVFENITERIETQQLIQENLEEKKVMLQEIHHRVKNNLAVVSGLLEMQSFHIEDSKSKMILNESTNRIISIAKIHELLYESEKFNSLPFENYISDLSEIIISSMNDEDKSIDVDIDISVQNLNISHGVPLGIIFNELITNSVKYGFQKKEGNKIEISVESANNFIEVVYKDNGIGIDNFEAASGKSLGFTLIKSLFEQIDANYVFDTKNRFKLSFSFPITTDEYLVSF